MDNATNARQETTRNAAVTLGLVTVAFAVGLVSPLPALAADDWGDSYDNGSGMTVCICDDKIQECAPCYVIPE